MGKLRDYQAAAIENIRQAVREGERRIVLQLPTGGGKTRIAAEIVNGSSSKKKRVVFAVPVIALVDQTVEMFYAEGIRNVGVIQANHHMTDWSQPIQIASVPTLRNRGLPRADVVIRDECHHLFEFDKEWMKNPEWANVPFIGLSATPWTKGLGKVYSRLIVGETAKGLIEKKYLVPPKVYVPKLKADLSGVRTTAGDYNEGDLSKAMNRSMLVADVVDTWCQQASGLGTICFAVDRAHAKALQEKFIAGGVSAGYMDCNTSPQERRIIRQQFERGDISVCCNVDVIGMGVDWPEIGCISYCRPTKSEMRFVQNIGRGLRLHPGKSELLILDHSDTSQRLGFVQDIHHEELDGGRKALALPPKPKLPKECKACHMLRPPGVSECPHCGHKIEPKISQIEAAEGELIAFDGKKLKKPKAAKPDKESFYAELLGYMAIKKYNNAHGWIAHKYKDKFGVWPVGMHDVLPRTPSIATLNWIRSRNIAWAKSKRTVDNAEMARLAAEAAALMPYRREA